MTPPATHAPPAATPTARDTPEGVWIHSSVAPYAPEKTDDRYACFPFIYRDILRTEPLIRGLHFFDLFLAALSQPIEGLFFCPRAKLQKAARVSPKKFDRWIAAGLVAGSDVGPVPPYTWALEGEAPTTLLTPPPGLPCWYLPAVMREDLRVWRQHYGDEIPEFAEIQ